jgi:hypothetical protein
MDTMKKIFAVVFFGVCMLIAFPLVNNMFTAPDGFINSVGNVTVGHPYSAFENLLWKNWHYLIFGVASIGFAVWLFKDNEGR